jgi:hypothetical protein
MRIHPISFSGFLYSVEPTDNPLALMLSEYFVFGSYQAVEQVDTLLPQGKRILGSPNLLNTHRLPGLC